MRSHSLLTLLHDLAVARCDVALNAAGGELAGGGEFASVQVPARVSLSRGCASTLSALNMAVMCMVQYSANIYLSISTLPGGSSQYPCIGALPCACTLLCCSMCELAPPFQLTSPTTSRIELGIRMRA